ncbi:O-antigen ligase family protein [Pseudoduganella namucuonensis]|uniref:O-antigen ligase domain-containing protein n=1 Tax=Pseudoduganella namucuonensis TaxID=1035707 RepID=A0A1I7I0W5_9BURK|nr:hypothetical protein [Pseudoduganella namucuonensis]SFU66588.1 hypothetical protein SAMN05216552_100712 [Pseudoduganella namucuonensis]
MIKTSRGQSWTGLLLSGLLLLTAAFVGLLIGAEMHVLIVLFMLLLLAMPMLYLALYGFEDRAGWLLAGGFCLMYVAQMAHNKGVPIGYAMEFMAFVFMLSSLRQLWRLARQDAALRWLALLFLGYLALLLLSSALGRSQPRAALWQLQYTLKLPLMFALGALVVHTARTAGTLRGVLAWSWVFFLPFLLLELAAPGLFLKLFGYTADAHVNPVLGFGARLRGPFSHAGYMALMCGLLAAGSAVQWLLGRGRSWLALAGVYTVMVLATGQRQELLALVLVYGVFATIAGRRHLGWLWLGAVLAVAAGVLAYLYLDRNPFSELMLQWGGGRDSQLSERGVLTQKGLQVAAQYFPLGSGLGTYGSAGAQKFDLGLMVDLGFMRYWWFRQGMFIVDTYWPSVIAEAGYAAAALLLAAFALLWGVLYRRALLAQGEVRAIALFALAALTLALATSPTSAVVSDPRGVFVFWLLAGCAWRATSEARAAARAGATVDYRATPDGPLRHNPGTDLSFRFRPS